MITKPKDLPTNNPVFLEWMRRVILPICTVRKVDIEDLCVGIRLMEDITGVSQFNVRLVGEADKEIAPYVDQDLLTVEDWTEGRTNAEIVVSLHNKVSEGTPTGGFVIEQFPGYYIQMHSSFEHFLKFFITYKESEIINAIIVVDSTRIM